MSASSHASDQDTEGLGGGQERALTKMGGASPRALLFAVDLSDKIQVVGPAVASRAKSFPPINRLE